VADAGITNIVHLAGLQVPFCAANPPLGAMVNVVGTVNVFEAVKRAGRQVGLAYASSAAVYGASSGAGVVGDLSPVAPQSHYGVYKVANEGTARIYAESDGIGSIGLRPFVVYGLARDQGMSSEPTKAMLAAAAGRPYHMRFGGSVWLTHAEDCARTFIAASRAAAGSGDAIALNVPGRRGGIAELVELIEAAAPGSKERITWDAKALPVASLVSPPPVEEAMGATYNRPLAEGVATTIEQFRTALAAGLVEPPGA
jgi:nucleoside-diphosphate-sugar epimerase